MVKHTLHYGGFKLVMGSLMRLLLICLHLWQHMKKGAESLAYHIFTLNYLMVKRILIRM